MARAPWAGDAVYRAAHQFVEQGLRRDGSIFTPSRRIWTLEAAHELDQRVGQPDPSKRSFGEKLRDQLAGLTAEAIQLAAELLYVELLPEADTSGQKKREHLQFVLATLPEPLQIPPDLGVALDDERAVAAYGAGKNNRDAFLRLLIQFLLAWKSHSPAERDRLLQDPWSFREFVQRFRTSKAAMQAEAVLHLVFPQTFEYVVAPRDKQKIANTFAAAPGVADADNVDRKLERVRTAVSPVLGEEFKLYGDLFRRVWDKPEPHEWQELTSWAARLYELPDFDASERHYKLQIAARIAVAREAVCSGADDWQDKLKRAFMRKNNLTSWRTHSAFLTWCDAHQEQAQSLLSALWSAEPAEEGLSAFLEGLPREVAPGPGVRLSIASFLLMGADANRYPVFRAEPYRRARMLLGRNEHRQIESEGDGEYRPGDLADALGRSAKTVRDYLRERFPREEAETGMEWRLTPEQAQAVVEHFGSTDAALSSESYWDFLAILDELRLRLLMRGVLLRDRLDAQGLLWWVANGDPPGGWSEEEQAALLAFRGGERGPQPERDLPLADDQLAQRLFLPRPWLQEVLDLLEEKQQLIFYGPPGTGKTYVAQAMGEHLARSGGDYRLVQFHPSYTYEDFFEGYRPVGVQEGQVSFELVPGPLKRLAKEADENPSRPYLLIIDEINRGNVSKIFGELYYLLEYRDQDVELQYSRGERFSLPENLYVIGTMNTADRSIALVDSALRRRFYFVPFLPRQEPIRSVLPRWLEQHGLDPEPATLLDALNESIGDEDFAIGPSYFMVNRDGGGPSLDRIWRYAIKPLLEEHYYGSGRDVEAEFGPQALRRLAARSDEQMEEEVPQPQTWPEQ